MPHLSANGQMLYFEDQGKGSIPLVFSHGLLMDHEMFAPQVAALSQTSRCVSWDQRGHGQTREDGEPFSYWDSAADCRAILDHLGIEKAVLVGLSQGGFLSMRLALEAPERVAGLVLISTQAGIDDDAVYENFRGLKAEWSANGPANAGAGVASMLIGDPGLEAEWLAKWHKEPKSRLGNCIDTLIARDDLTSRLAELTCPALVIHGVADGAIPISLATTLAEGLPDCRAFVQIEGAAHAPTLTHPKEVTDAISLFVSGL
jgi:3-oxoadipate enol-lactonase